MANVTRAAIAHPIPPTHLCMPRHFVPHNSEFTSNYSRSENKNKRHEKPIHTQTRASMRKPRYNATTRCRYRFTACSKMFSIFQQFTVTSVEMLSGSSTHRSRISSQSTSSCKPTQNVNAKDCGRALGASVSLCAASGVPAPPLHVV